jgi:recombination protein RecA
MSLAPLPSPRGNADSATNDALQPDVEHRHGWSWEEMRGRLAELSVWGGGASLTSACRLLLEAQLANEPVAWVATEESSFFPPDLARNGVDLDALPVVRTPDAHAAARAADKLVRSGAFGLVVVDLVSKGPRAFVPTPLQSRLLGLAAKHGTALLFLTEKKPEAPSLGSLISLRAQARRKRTTENHFSCEVEILKDKRKGPGRSGTEMHHGPAGLH